MWLISLLLIISISVDSVFSGCKNDFKITCYWASWSVYRQKNGKFTPEDLSPELCTTIIYSFAGLGPNFDVQSLDTNADIVQGGFAKVVDLKTKNPCLKVVLSIGGWSEGSAKYSVMAHTDEGRKAFANSVLRFISYYGFDGVDLDWEFPTERGGIESDKATYPLLLKELKDAFSPWGYTLSIAVSADEYFIDKAYDVPQIAKYVDHIHLMAYDYVTAASNVTGLNSPLSAIEKGIQAWIKAGSPPEKLLLGLATYGRSFLLKDPKKHALGDPVTEPGYPGEFTAAAGYLAYYEILKKFSFNHFTVEEVDGTNYAYCDEDWITFDNPKTIALKTKLAKDKGVGGVMLWSTDTDDFKGTYGKQYPLLNAVHEAIK